MPGQPKPAPPAEKPKSTSSEDLLNGKTVGTDTPIKPAPAQAKPAPVAAPAAPSDDVVASAAKPKQGRV
jgi:hypothetical protein